MGGSLRGVQGFWAGLLDGAQDDGALGGRAKEKLRLEGNHEYKNMEVDLLMM